MPPSLTEVKDFIKNVTNWPDEFINYYGEKFYYHYDASGWKLSNGNAVKKWTSCFHSQWKHLRFKEDIEFLNKCQSKKIEIKEMKTDTEIERLDQLLAQYKAKFESVPFDEFGKWYDFMGKQKFLTKLSPDDVEIIKKAYPGDNYKCRCAHVKLTFDGFVNNAMSFGEIVNIRKKLNP